MGRPLHHHTGNGAEEVTTLCSRLGNRSQGSDIEAESTPKPPRPTRFLRLVKMADYNLPKAPLLDPCVSLLDQLLHGVINDLLASAAEPLVTDHPLVVDEINCRRARQVPFLGDGSHFRARPRIAERPPGKVLLLHEFLEGRGARFTDVDADDGEWLAGELLDERPLVRPHGPSGASVLVPEIEQHHLAAVVAQLEPIAVLVLALDLGGNLADGKVQEIVQLRLGLVPNRTAAR